MSCSETEQKKLLSTSMLNKWKPKLWNFVFLISNCKIFPWGSMIGFLAKNYLILNETGFALASEISTINFTFGRMRVVCTKKQYTEVVFYVTRSSFVLYLTAFVRYHCVELKTNFWNFSTCLFCMHINNGPLIIIYEQPYHQHYPIPNRDRAGPK